MKSSAKKVKLASVDDLFSTEESRSEEGREKVVDIPLSELHSFKNHPFKVKDDEAMMDTAESIRQHGVLVPAIARPDPEGGYELISGHRRHHASEIAGRETMPVIIRELDDDAATIIMVDSNLQREELLPSERAFAYKMKLEAMKRQAGRPQKENCSQLGNDFGKKSSELLAEQIGQSKNQIFRYIRLTELIPPLLDLVDEKKIACKEAIEAAVREHYRDNQLDEKGAQEVLAAFGMERTLYVLANTVREKDWDGRFSHTNKSWARTVPVFADMDRWNQNRNLDFVVDACHPGLTDLFLDQVRREQHLRTPISDEEIKAEAARLLSELRAQGEPNSLNGTHFMAEVSKDFMQRSSSKDMDRLMGMFPFRSAAFSGLQGRKGHYLLIPKSEDRSQPLKRLRRSVRTQLGKGEKQPGTKSKKEKSREKGR